jgi:hypothetical protein
MGPKEQHVIIERLIAERRRRGWDKPEMARRLRQELTGGQARDPHRVPRIRPLIPTPGTTM